MEASEVPTKGTTKMNLYELSQLETTNLRMKSFCTSQYRAGPVSICLLNILADFARKYGQY